MYVPGKRGADYDMRVEILCINQILIVRSFDSGPISCPIASTVPFQHFPPPPDP